MSKIIAAALSLLVLLGLGCTPSRAETLSYGSAGNWTVSAVFDDDTGGFVFCSAGTAYRDATFFMINVDHTGGLSLSLFNDRWPKGRTGSLPVRIRVDGRPIGTSTATWLNNGVLINFGHSPEKLVSIMRGYRLAIITSLGTSEFSLKGSYAASMKTLDCFKAGLARSQQAGAFDGSPSGAFGSPRAGTQTSTTPPQSSLSVLSRAETMEIAAIYLGKAGLPYTITSEEENYFNNLPVNWKYGADSVGGMTVLTGTGISGEAVFVSLLQDQAKLCTQNSAIKRLPPTPTEDGGMAFQAHGACQTEDSLFSTSYQVLSGDGFAIIIVELVGEEDQGDYTDTEKPQVNPNELLTKFTPQ
ncbi:hypothetical protein [Methyloligella solikamskensis]|uniref:Uncharacterized protein n=1 Tax=Methyloligella solikamskensis TaxID=1177756 RepID=A0ABW3J6J2_9HYPH